MIYILILTFRYMWVQQQQQQQKSWIMEDVLVKINIQAVLHIDI